MRGSKEKCYNQLLKLHNLVINIYSFEIDSCVPKRNINYYLFQQDMHQEILNEYLRKMRQVQKFNDNNYISLKKENKKILNFCTYIQNGYRNRFRQH